MIYSRLYFYIYLFFVVLSSKSEEWVSSSRGTQSVCMPFVSVPISIWAAAQGWTAGLSSPQCGVVWLQAGSCWYCVPSAPAEWVYSQVGWVSWQTAYPALESPKTAGSQPSTQAPGTHTYRCLKECVRESSVSGLMLYWRECVGVGAALNDSLIFSPRLLCECRRMVIE